MKSALYLSSILFFFIHLPVLAAEDTTSDIVKKASAYDVPTTMNRLVDIITEKGMTIFARINHKENANKQEMNMPDSEVLIFGNPAAGTAIMKHDLLSALDLPLRVLVYKDFDGKVWLAYHDPKGLRTHYRVEKCMQVGKVSTAMDKITEHVVTKTETQ